MFEIKIGSTFSHEISDAKFFAEKNTSILLILPRGGGHHTERERID